MDELLEQFLIEGRDLVLQGQADLLVLAQDPANARAIDGAFRAVHTLKGSVAIFAMMPAERVLHAVESILETARRTAAISVDLVPRLVAALDQVDRWIDQMESDGALGTDAESLAAALLDEAGPETITEARTAPIAQRPAWVVRLVEREAESLAGAAGPMMAFRYAPDADAFFRGDDPLALVGSVSGLVALSILPASGQWPDRADIDPFQCGMVIEGATEATLERLQAIFRLVPDQTAFHPLAMNRPAALPASTGGATVLRVEAARVDRLAERVGELAVASNALAAIADRAQRLDPALALAIRAAQADLDRAVGAVSRSVSAVRLVPLGPSLARLPRLVRDTASGLGKVVRFSIAGDQIEVDKQIADGIFEPLLHLIRNALDHGIEPAEARQVAGKPEEGQVSLQIGREGEDVVILLSDDGAGIDPDHIRSIAVTRGIIDAEDASRLTDAASLALIFTPGFSTAVQVSDVSGRGVGMDAVQAAIDRLRGRIEIESQRGGGTRFRLRLPANALTTRLLVVDVGDDHFAIPFDQIVETVRIENDRLLRLGSGFACVLRNRTVPVLALAELLGRQDIGIEPARLLVTDVGGEPVALRVDGFGDRIDAMVRAPHGLLAGVPSVAGTALRGDGSVLLVLSLPELVA